MVADSLSGSNLHIHRILVQSHLVIAWAHHFRIATERRFPPLLIQFIIAAGGRHHIQTHRHPAV